MNTYKVVTYERDFVVEAESFVYSAPSGSTPGLMQLTVGSEVVACFVNPIGWFKQTDNAKTPLSIAGTHE